MPSAIEAELGSLCRSCGLCCDGSLFGCVTLEPDEARDARKGPLHVLQRGNAFEQPCSALTTLDNGCGCSIYPDRPRACRAFTCRLYERHRREGGPLEPRVQAVQRVRALLSLVETTNDEEARRKAVVELTEQTEEHFARG
jgi:Fe-S-cluster containining protein